MKSTTKIAGVRFKERAAQGELGIVRLPDSYKLPNRAYMINSVKANGRSVLVIGHSETGHHHVMDAEKVYAYEMPDEAKMLLVKEESALTHLRDYDTHKPLIFEPGKYMVTTLREFDAVKQQSYLSRD